jgi:hypothetical protein
MTTKPFTNVREQRAVYDTILLTPEKNLDVTGWFSQYSSFAAQPEHAFFNVRNRNVGIAYNNQDKRDSVPYPIRAESIGVAFFGPSIKTLQNLPPNQELQQFSDQMVWWWEHDLPRHCSIEFRVNQDEIIACNSFCCSPGYGPTGGGFGRGGWAKTSGQNERQISMAKGYVTQGIPDISNRWPFPKKLEIPRDASISGVIKVNEYARKAIDKFPNRYIVTLNYENEYRPIIPYFGIQISIFGQMLLQQRGQYHR